MKLIIGGAYQGKLAYAKDRYKITEGWIDGSCCGEDELWSCRGICHFHEYVRRMLEEKYAKAGENGIQPQALLTAVNIEEEAARFAHRLYQHNPGIVVISNELGCGVVPVERFDRMWRELTGRICVCLAEYSEEVIRVVCGLGITLKGCCREECAYQEAGDDEKMEKQMKKQMEKQAGEQL